MNFNTQKLRDIRLSQKFADASSLINALDSLDNKLSDMSIDDDITQLSNVCIVLNQIIQHFGGKPNQHEKIIVKVDISQDDIDNGRNIVYFSSDPILLGYSATPIIWGD